MRVRAWNAAAVEFALRATNYSRFVIGQDDQQLAVILCVCKWGIMRICL